MSVTSDTSPKILDVPIGLDATGLRREFDSLGDVEVPADRYWGAQTQRSLEHFNIGNDRMPKEVYHAYGYVKKAAAIVNTQAGRMPKWKGELIERVSDEVTRQSSVSRKTVPRTHKARWRRRPTAGRRRQGRSTSLPG